MEVKVRQKKKMRDLATKHDFIASNRQTTKIIDYEKSNINYHYLIGNNMPTKSTESYWKSN